MHRILHQVALLLLGVLLIHACQSAQAIETEPPSGFATPSVRDDITCFSQPPHPPLNLINVLCLAIQSSSALRRADGVIQERRGNRLKSYGSYLPTITLAGNTNHFKKNVEYNDYPGNNYSLDGRNGGLSLSLNWLLYDFGLRKANLAQAIHLIEAASLNRDQVVREIAIAAADVYFKAEAAQALLRESIESEHNAAESADVADALMLHGAGSVSDKLLAQNAHAQASLQRVDAENSLAIALADLSTVIGQSPDLAPDIIERPASTSRIQRLSPLPGWNEDYVQQSPRIRQLREEVLAAQSQVAIARSQSLPTLAFVATTYRETTPPSQSMVAQTVKGWSVGFQLKIPLFDGLVRQSGLSIAQAQLYQKQMELREAERKIAAAIWSSRQSLSQNTKKIAIANRISTNAHLAYRAALIRYRSGAGSIVELLKSQSDLSDARRTVINILRDGEMAKFRYSIDIGKISYAGQFTKPLD